MITRNSVYILATIFAIGLIVLLVLNPAIKGYLEPTILDTVDGSTLELLESKYNFLFSMIDKIPYVLFISGIIYLFILIFRGEKVQKYV